MNKNRIRIPSLTIPLLIAGVGIACLMFFVQGRSRYARHHPVLVNGVNCAIWLQPGIKPPPPQKVCWKWLWEHGFNHHHGPYPAGVMP